ncbi:MAG TPA: kelch repeat-containing protein [Streptosporangiaceae bacterium]|nr:kelch repeat-containing protein [Streptosporangiaceae bacterium]
MSKNTRQVITLATAAILVAVMLIGGGWWIGRRGAHEAGTPGRAPSAPTSSATAEESTPATSPEPPGRPGEAPAGVWRRLPAAPLSGWHAGAVGVWTGSELLVYGWRGTIADDPATIAGAAYHPARRTWRRLAPMPAPRGDREGYNSAVWTGREMIVRGFVTAAFNPMSNRWRSLPPAPEGAPDVPSVMVWTGRQVLMWGGGCCDEYGSTGAAYTPATNSWRMLPASPLAGRRTVGAWTGTELVIVGGFGLRDDTGYQTFADAAAYNPATRRWRRLPSLPAPRQYPTATWTGTEVLVVGGSASRPTHLYAEGAAYNPAANRWRRLAAMPEGGRVDHTAVWTGRRLLVWGGQTVRDGAWTVPSRGLAYDPAADRWSALPVSPLRGRVEHAAVWTGRQLLIWGGVPIGGDGSAAPFMDGAGYTP